jgi:hypothetical protein
LTDSVVDGMECAANSGAVLMSSGIDSSKPLDGVPAVKADLRDNLEIARIELNHGGFAEGLAPANYSPPPTTRVRDHLAMLDQALAGKVDSASHSFVALGDTPATYDGAASQFVKVKADASGLEFVTSGGATHADAVEYSPPFGGAAAGRNVQSRLADRVTVKDFGALGDGSGDDTAAIQAAVDSGAREILFPPGEYSIGTCIEVGGTIRLLGRGATIKARAGIATTGTESCLFKLIANRGTIEGFTCDGNGLTESCVKTVGSNRNRFKLDDLYLIGATARGVDFDGNNTWMSVLERVRVDSVPTGFYMRRSAGDNTTLTLNSCYAAGNSLCGFNLQCMGAVLNACAVDGCGGYPIEVGGPSMVQINGFDVETSARWIKLDGPNVNVTMICSVLNGYNDSGGAIIDITNGKLVMIGCRWFNGSGSHTFVSVASGKTLIARDNTSRVTAQTITGSGIVRELFENTFYAHN